MSINGLFFSFCNQPNALRSFTVKNSFMKLNFHNKSFLVFFHECKNPVTSIFEYQTKYIFPYGSNKTKASSDSAIAKISNDTISLSDFTLLEYSTSGN